MLNSVEQNGNKQNFAAHLLNMAQTWHRAAPAGRQAILMHTCGWGMRAAAWWIPGQKLPSHLLGARWFLRAYAKIYTIAAK